MIFQDENLRSRFARLENLSSNHKRKSRHPIALPPQLELEDKRIKTLSKEEYRRYKNILGFTSTRANNGGTTIPDNFGARCAIERRVLATKKLIENVERTQEQKKDHEIVGKMSLQAGHIITVTKFPKTLNGTPQNFDAQCDKENIRAPRPSTTQQVCSATPSGKSKENTISHFLGKPFDCCDRQITTSSFLTPLFSPKECVLRTQRVTATTSSGLSTSTSAKNLAFTAGNRLFRTSGNVNKPVMTNTDTENLTTTPNEHIHTDISADNFVCGRKNYEGLYEVPQDEITKLRSEREKLALELVDLEARRENYMKSTKGESKPGIKRYASTRELVRDYKNNTIKDTMLDFNVKWKMLEIQEKEQERPFPEIGTKFLDDLKIMQDKLNKRPHSMKRSSSRGNSHISPKREIDKLASETNLLLKLCLTSTNLKPEQFEPESTSGVPQEPSSRSSLPGQDGFMLHPQGFNFTPTKMMTRGLNGSIASMQPKISIHTFNTPEFKNMSEENEASMSKMKFSSKMRIE